jgi:hypothetical protein
MKSWNHCVGTCVLALVSLAAWADVEVVQVGETRLEVVVRDASNREILESLGNKLSFNAVVEDSGWASERRSFERTTDIDTLLRSLLSGTNSVLSYVDQSVSSVTVLAPGSPRPFLSFGSEVAPTTDATLPNVSASSSGYEGRPLTTAKANSRLSGTKPGSADEREVDKDIQPAPTPVADLLRTRAQINPVKVVAGTGSQEAPSVPAYAGGIDGIDQATMQRLTRQAHQDVKNIAEMLRRAEAQLAAESPE